MKSRALSAALWLCLASDNGTIQFDTRVMPIMPFCNVCTKRILAYKETKLIYIYMSCEIEFS